MTQQQNWTFTPSSDRWLTYLWLGLSMDLLFLLVYGGAALINLENSHRLHLYVSWETTIPLIPEFIYPYASILILFLLPPFALETGAMRNLAIQLAAATLLAGVLFILLPTQPGFAPDPLSQVHTPILIFLYSIDAPVNLFPSLHIAYSILLAISLAAVSPRWFRTVLAGWIVLICLSVVLVHQHHLLDIAGGILLVIAVTRIGNNTTLRAERRTIS